MLDNAKEDAATPNGACFRLHEIGVCAGPPHRRSEFYNEKGWRLGGLEKKRQDVCREYAELHETYFRGSDKRQQKPLACISRQLLCLSHADQFDGRV